MIGIGVIGYGYWGPNLVRNFQETPDCRVVGVSDLRPERLALVEKRHPTMAVTRDYRDLLRRPDVDAIVVATPVSAHAPLASQALAAGKHVFVEKPLAPTAETASRLIDEAARRRLTLMVDHTFVYTGAVRKIRELIAGGDLGDLYYYDSVRVNLGLFQHDVNVVWDLAVHDLSILDHLLPQKPKAVSATGMKHFPSEPENIAYLTLHFDGPMIAHIHVNWLAPVKVRRTLIGGSQRMIVYDDVEPSEKVKIYDKGVRLHAQEERKETIYQMLVGYRTGAVLAPELDMTEALKLEARHFVECVTQGRRPITDGEAGLRVVQILEAATESMSRRGQVVELGSIQVPA